MRTIRINVTRSPKANEETGARVQTHSASFLRDISGESVFEYLQLKFEMSLLRNVAKALPRVDAVILE